MTPNRFETLAEAHGGDVARWPDAEREAAAELMAASPNWASDILAVARDLDVALASLEAPRGSTGLAERITAGAPQPRRAWSGWLAPAGMGAGLAAACAAGVMLGLELAQPTSSEAEALVSTLSADDGGLYLDEDA